MWLRELILTPIFVKPRLNGLKAATPLVTVNIWFFFAVIFLGSFHSPEVVFEQLSILYKIPRYVLTDTDVNSRFHSSTLIWIPVIVLSSAKQTSTKYEQVLYWRLTCISFLAVFYKRCLNIHGLPTTFQKLINCVIRGIGVGRGCGNNRLWIIDE